VTYEQFFQSFSVIFIDSVALGMVVSQMANATSIDASGFTASFTRIDVVAGRRMQGALTGISTQQCDTTENLAFVRVVFSSANYTLIEAVVNAIKDRSGILHNILNSDGQTLAECAEVDYIVSRDIISAPPPPSVSPPATPPLEVHFDNFMFVSIIMVIFFTMANLCVIQSRSKPPEAILNALVASEAAAPAEKRVSVGEGLPLLIASAK